MTILEFMQILDQEYLENMHRQSLYQKSLTLLEERFHADVDPLEAAYNQALRELEDKKAELNQRKSEFFKNLNATCEKNSPEYCERRKAFLTEIDNEYKPYKLKEQKAKEIAEKTRALKFAEAFKLYDLLNQRSWKTNEFWEKVKFEFFEMGWADMRSDRKIDISHMTLCQMLKKKTGKEWYYSIGNVAHGTNGDEFIMSNGKEMAQPSPFQLWRTGTDVELNFFCENGESYQVHTAWSLDYEEVCGDLENINWFYQYMRSNPGENGERTLRKDQYHEPKKIPAIMAECLAEFCNNLEFNPNNPTEVKPVLPKIQNPNTPEKIKS